MDFKLLKSKNWVNSFLVKSVFRISWLPYLENPDLEIDQLNKFAFGMARIRRRINRESLLFPLILSAALVNTDPLAKYEILNSATEFNRDPILWMEKIKAAEAIGLDNYAAEALIQLQEWLSSEEILVLQNRKQLKIIHVIWSKSFCR